MKNAKVTYAQAVATLKAHPAAGTKDIAYCLTPSSQHFYSESMHAWAVDKGIDVLRMLSLPQKQVKRFTQFLGVMVSGVLGDLDYTHARILVAMHLAGDYALTTDAITLIAANARSGDVNTRGVSLGAVNRIFKQSHDVGTVKTKVSNSTGKNGFYQVLGITSAAPGERNHAVTLNRAHPLTARFFELINGATVGQIDAMMGDK